LKGVAAGVRSSVEKALKSVTDDAVNLVSGFVRDSRKLILTHAGPYTSPARYASLILNSLSNVECLWMHPQDLMYYLAPYEEGEAASVLITSPDEGINTLAMLLDQLTWTGHSIALVTQHELPEIIAYKIPDTAAYVSLDTSEWLLAVHILLARAAAKACREGLRHDRIVREVSDLTSVVDDLIEEYSDDLERVADFIREPVVITSSPTMWGVAESIAYSRVARKGRYLVEPEAVSQVAAYVGRVLLISTDVEEYSMRLVKSLQMTSSASVIELKLHTDPLTAPIYGLMLAKALELAGSA